MEIRNFFVYNAKIDVEDGDTSCVICLEDFKLSQFVKNTPCGHKFHRECLYEWLKINTNCPYCKLDLVKQKHVNLRIN